MSDTTYARALLSGWLAPQVVQPDADWRCSLLLQDQRLSLSLQGSTLLLFMPVYSLNLAQDGELLALGMMMNLKPDLAGGAALGLDAERRELVLTARLSLEGTDARTLTRWAENAAALGKRLRDEFSDAAACHATPRPVVRSLALQRLISYPS